VEDMSFRAVNRRPVGLVGTDKSSEWARGVVNVVGHTECVAMTHGLVELRSYFLYVSRV
jgi:hypothetical protein